MSLLTSFRESSGGAITTPALNRAHGDASDDEFRRIKWHFLAHAGAELSSGKNPRVILITSALPGEGKSFVSHRLAANFALDPQLELTLIDADFDSPALGSSSWMGGSSGGPGLLDYLEGDGTNQASIVKSTGLANVKVILSGSSRDHAPELFANGRLEGLLASLTGGANRFVIMDAGPVLTNGGAAVLGRYAGQIGFVLASNSTGRSEINQALAALDRIAGPIEEKFLGLIFN